MQEFDYIVIGGGSGGIASARRAASYGAKVALVEKSRLGGTCVNVGCVPKKVMWNAAEVVGWNDLSRDYGFTGTGYKFDWGQLKSARDAYILRLNGIYQKLLAEVTVFEGYGKLLGESTVDAGGTTIKGKHILLATGGYPVIPEIPDAELGITSDGFFELAEQPQKVVIAGSGYIAVELAGVFAALGSEVEIIIRKDGILRSFDRDIASRLEASLTHHNVKISKKTEITSVVKNTNGGLTVTDSQKESRETDCLVWAIGRRPSTDSLGLEAAGVKTTNGFVDVDEYQNTSQAGVYAVGDMIGKVDLTPVAIAAGRKLAARLFLDEKDAKISYENIPTVVFSHPPIGTIGLSEEQAIDQHGSNQVKCYRSEFTDMTYALSEYKPKTFMKLVTVGDDEKVVGLHVIGKGADEMTQGFGVGLIMGATKKDFDATMAIHPTASEEFVTMT